MKLKEVCRATGLTRKTIRLYEEHGLVAPKKERYNGRDYRDYSQADVEMLKTVAALRRAWFTMDEIRRMQEDPAAIRQIVPGYAQWLRAQQKQLEGLLYAVERLGPEQLDSVEALSRHMAEESQRLPLPPEDVRPRFRYLDELEERPLHVEPQTNFAEDGGNAGFWQLSMERKGGLRPASYEDYFRGIGLRDYPVELENGTVASRIDRDSRPLRRLKLLYTGLSAALGLWFFVSLFRWGVDVYQLLPAVLFGAALGFRLLLALYSWRRDRRGWLSDTLDAEERKGERDMKKISWSYVATLVLVLLISLPVGGRLWSLHRLDGSFRQREDVSFQPTSVEKTRRKLTQWGIDTTMPGNGDAVLTFTAAFPMMFRDTAYNDQDIHRGDVLSSDFVSWSHDFFRERYLRLTVNGKTVDARLTNFQAARLYVSALKQNGLAERFREDAGHRLTLFSAQRAMRRLDRTLFEQGIYRAYDYPYDRRLEETILALVILFSVPIAAVLLAAVSSLADYVRYRRWLAVYNREHTEDWNRLVGTLPQFVSLRESGIRGPTPEFRRRGLRERFRKLYRA